MSQSTPGMQGLYVDLVAPCAADGHFLPREYHVHLRRMARVRDIQGVIVNGPAGEASVLDSTIRNKILGVALSASPPGFPLFAAIPADVVGLTDESKAATERGATGIVVIGRGSNVDDREALQRVINANPNVPVVAWSPSVEMINEVSGAAAIVLETPGQSVHKGSVPIMLTDSSFDLGAISSGAATGAVLASANIGEAHWGKVFRYVSDAHAQAETIFTERVRLVQETVVALGNPGAHDNRTFVAAIKHALFTMTQNTSAATLQPLIDMGDEARRCISDALVTGRLMPGMV